MLQDFDLRNAAWPLLTWYDRNARDLPWRRTKDPYKIWISEIMLQQTRVDAVIPYFQRFLAALPDVQALAACPEEELLKLWEGLGYYSRARNLQAAARQILEEQEGVFPNTAEALQRLKGIGPYTAGAIASIAFGRRAAAVDGNVLRVLTRASADPTDIAEASFRKRVEAAIEEAMPEGKCGEFTQALMELGACICLPNGLPKCEVCPWESVCIARRKDSVLLYPVKRAKKPRRIEEKTVLVIWDGERIALRKRPNKGLLAGLYEFPWMEGFADAKEAGAFAEALGFTAHRILELSEAKHIFTHVEWRMKGFAVRVTPENQTKPPLILAKQEDIQTRYPLPSAFAAFKEKGLRLLAGEGRF